MLALWEFVFIIIYHYNLCVMIVMIFVVIITIVIVFVIIFTIVMTITTVFIIIDTIVIIFQLLTYSLWCVKLSPRQYLGILLQSVLVSNLQNFHGLTFILAKVVHLFLQTYVFCHWSQVALWMEAMHKCGTRESTPFCLERRISVECVFANSNFDVKRGLISYWSWKPWWHGPAKIPTITFSLERVECEIGKQV